MNTNTKSLLALTYNVIFKWNTDVHLVQVLHSGDCDLAGETAVDTMHVTPQFTTSDPLRSRLIGFEAGQLIQFQSWSDLNWLAMLTESVYKLELHAATVIRR